MSTNLLGIFLFLTLFHYSIQYRCYDCATTTPANSVKLQSVASKPYNLPQTSCGSELNDNLLKDCPGDCRKAVWNYNGTITTYRSCIEDFDCNLLQTAANLTGSTIDCYSCSKDKCNSAMNAIASSSLLAISLSFVAFRIFFS